MKTLRLLVIFIVFVISSTLLMLSQNITNLPLASGVDTKATKAVEAVPTVTAPAHVQSTRHKPRPLTESEANEVRSHNLDPTGMTIDAGLPIERELMPQEIEDLVAKGYDKNDLIGKKFTLVAPEDSAALERLISKAEQAARPTPSDLKNAFIWMDKFMGRTNANLMADVISMKAERLKFNLLGQNYDYSGHYTVMLTKPREHKKPYFGFGTPPTAKIVILENYGGKTMSLVDATIWEKSDGFIDVTAMGIEWIHSGTYTIQN